MEWIEQVWLQDRNCQITTCGKRIPAETLYYRATLNADSPDAEGYDCCAECREKQPNPPSLKP